MKKLFRSFIVTVMVLFSAQLLAFDATQSDKTQCEFNIAATPAPDIVTLSESDIDLAISQAVTETDRILYSKLLALNHPVSLEFVTFTENQAVKQNQNFDRMYRF